MFHLFFSEAELFCQIFIFLQIRFGHFHGSVHRQIFHQFESLFFIGVYHGLFWMVMMFTFCVFFHDLGNFQSYMGICSDFVLWNLSCETFLHVFDALSDFLVRCFHLEVRCFILRQIHREIRFVTYFESHRKLICIVVEIIHWLWHRLTNQP
ncbi:hypothetical protein SDC9_182219 [bioreactor metagenome]|uniref:Uncharacterized protein n=1 Tax=bioreactor metagenome TaxID=1076179 RepID=A0A645H6W1_9ZZZZ